MWKTASSCTWRTKVINWAEYMWKTASPCTWKHGLLNELNACLKQPQSLHLENTCLWEFSQTHFPTFPTLTDNDAMVLKLYFSFVLKHCFTMLSKPEHDQWNFFFVLTLVLAEPKKYLWTKVITLFRRLSSLHISNCCILVSVYDFFFINIILKKITIILCKFGHCSMILIDILSP